MDSHSILCVIDFSASSKHALRWAASEASKNASTLTVIYPYRLYPVQEGIKGIQRRSEINDEAVRTFEKFAMQSLEGLNVSYDFKPEIGFVKDRVYSHSRQQQFSMTVISQQLARANRESISELIDLINSPLVIIP